GDLLPQSSRSVNPKRHGPGGGVRAETCEVLSVLPVFRLSRKPAQNRKTRKIDKDGSLDLGTNHLVERLASRPQDAVAFDSWPPLLARSTELESDHEGLAGTSRAHVPCRHPSDVLSRGTGAEDPSQGERAAGQGEVSRKTPGSQGRSQGL